MCIHTRGDGWGGGGGADSGVGFGLAEGAVDKAGCWGFKFGVVGLAGYVFDPLGEGGGGGEEWGWTVRSARCGAGRGSMVEWSATRRSRFDSDFVGFFFFFLKSRRGFKARD